MEKDEKEQKAFLLNGGGDTESCRQNESEAASGLPSACKRFRFSGVGFRKLLATWGCSFLLALLVSRILSSSSRMVKKHSCDTQEKGYVCRPEISHRWGQYSPYFSVASEIDDTLEEGCEITFAQILSRHGARDPTLKRSLAYATSILKLQMTTSEYPGKYAFLEHYKYNMGADQLNDFGKQQLFSSGVKFYNRYQKLTSDVLPFIRTSGQRRVVQSAESWMEGFHHAKLLDKSASKDEKYPYDMVTISEGSQFNNTLTHSLCTNIETGPMSNIVDDAKAAWLNVFGPPILARLQSDLPHSVITMDDMHNLMSMCPFDTVRSLKGHISPFCDLFTEEEWIQYDHYESLDKFYGWGNGNPLGPTNGVGFTNELIARLTNTPVVDHTSTNRTLDDNEVTFPIGKEFKLFADFSHDNDLTAAFYAMGLYNSTPMLSITQVDSMEYTKGWSSSWAVPFAARAYIEKMKCQPRSTSNIPKQEKAQGVPETSTSTETETELVRVIVNDRVMPLEFCNGDAKGRCKLSAFVEGLSFAREGGHWETCFLGQSQIGEVVLPSGKVVNGVVA